jgi:hypothetical protein
MGAGPYQLRDHANAEDDTKGPQGCSRWCDSDAHGERTGPSRAERASMVSTILEAPPCRVVVLPCRSALFFS